MLRALAIGIAGLALIGALPWWWIGSKRLARERQLAFLRRTLVR